MKKSAAAQHGVKRYPVGEFFQAEENEGLLRREEGALRIEDTQEAINAFVVAGSGQAIGFGRGVDKGLLGGDLLVHGAADGEGIGDLFEGALNGLFVLGDGDLALDFGGAVGGPGASIEEGHHDLRGIVPGAGAGFKETVEIAAGAAEGGGKGNAREESRAGGTDVGISGFEQVLGGEHIGPAQEDLGGDARIDVFGRDNAAQRRGEPGPVGGGSRAEQKVQGILVFGNLLGVEGRVPSSRVERCLGAEHIQFGREALSTG